MKTTLTILAVLISNFLFAQEDCRMKVQYLGYVDSSHVVSITNKSKCPSNYFVSNGGFDADDFYPTSIFIDSGKTVIVHWKTPLVCGTNGAGLRLSVYTEEMCSRYGFNCPFSTLKTIDVCGVLPIPSTNFFPTQKGNTITGTIDLPVPPKDADKYEVEMLLENGSTLKKVVKLVHVSGDRYSFTTTIN